MRRTILTSVFSFLSVVAMYAQSVLVATLTHGTDVTMFYGSYALQAAHEAAVSGDIINLSGGAFQATKISKSIILRGTGIDSEDPTCIVNDFTISIPEEDSNRFSMEGIVCTSTIFIDNTFCNPYFLKCQLNDLVLYYSSDNYRKATFVDCKIIGDFSASYKNDVQILNSYIKGLSCESGGSLTVMNCVISDSWISDISNSHLINCILVGDGESSSSDFLPSSTIATNCISVNCTNNIFEYLEKKTGCSTSTLTEVFKNYDGTYTDDQTFELTDAAKTTMLGTDGTQVGIYGGMVPYDSTPSYPLITKMNVSKKTTADGKLSVDIEVSAGK